MFIFLELSGGATQDGDKIMHCMNTCKLASNTATCTQFTLLNAQIKVKKVKI